MDIAKTLFRLRSQLPLHFPTLLLAAGLATAFGGTADAALTTESCNDVPPNTNLVGSCGGTGWADSCWSGINAEPICYFDDVIYSAQGYSNAGNLPGRGGRIGDGANHIVTRPLPTSMTASCAWVSFAYANFPNTNTTRDDISFGEYGGGAIPLKFGIESRGDRAPRAFVEFNGVAAPPRVYGPVVNVVEPGLAVVEICVNVDDLGNDELRIWTNPANLLGGETGLGSPDAMLAGYDAISSFATFFIQQETHNGSDTLRISMEGDTPASLAEVLAGIPIGLSRAARACSRTLDTAIIRATKIVHRKLTTCRASIESGSLDITPPDCDEEPQTRAAIVQAGLQMRGRILRTCTDAILATLPACAVTVDGLVAPDGATGCVVDAIRESVQSLLDATHGQ